MKNALLIATTLFLTLNSCGIKKVKNTEEVAITENLYNTKWKLIELDGKPVADKVNGKEPYLSFDETTKRYSASGGCNGLGGTFEVKGKEIIFSQGISTMMACMDMTVENGFRSIFGNTIQFSLSEDNVSKTKTLSLSKDKKVIARFAVANNESVAKLDGIWELDYISGPRIAFEGLYPDKKPTIQFDVEKGRITGNGSCNSYNGSVKIDGYHISFGAIASTKMMCPHIQGEDVYFQTLKKINRFDVQDDQLTFIMDDIAMMRFKKK
ncbi:META domain-containing protein [Parapedobacter sp. SGR-10]|uniref:META domain-containing protein n=1 Tax=Parapedobacter sp. SGR-10 TaxID=2710879 RepID=UPI0013D2E3C6|nr:META domain-containing protein [Parapedobacter sp. SGR-10]NGF55697.1 META domain-containing protein [Parapedobacter sp. SGR-10]